MFYPGWCYRCTSGSSHTGRGPTVLFCPKQDSFSRLFLSSLLFLRATKEGRICWNKWLPFSQLPVLLLELVSNAFPRPFPSMLTKHTLLGQDLEKPLVSKNLPVVLQGLRECIEDAGFAHSPILSVCLTKWSRSFLWPPDYSHHGR